MSKKQNLGKSPLLMRCTVKKTVTLAVLVVLALIAVGDVGSVNAQSRTRSAGFETPARLRGRVEFWKAIFGKYGKYQKIIHHRRYPQIAFKILDFSKAAEQLSPGAYDELVKRIEAEKVGEIQKCIQNLAETGTPKSSMEQYIVEQMKFLPGGKQKYQDVLDNDWVRTQTGIKEKNEEAIKRTGRYLPSIERIFVNEEHLPIELTRLPFIESSFNYTAYSSVGAAGIWQFMPSTARKYMMVGSSVDERLDPFSATRAAAKYFQQAYRSLGSWGLAVTSYNHGVAGVYKKTVTAESTDISELIERTSGEPVFGFASQNFFPEFLAALEVYEQRQKYFPGLELLPELKVREQAITKPMSLAQAAKVTGVSQEALIDANYALLKPVTSGRKPIPAGYSLRVPVGSVHTFVKDEPGYKKELEKEKNQPVTEPKVELPKPKHGKVQAKKGHLKKGQKANVKKGKTTKKALKKSDASTKKLKKVAPKAKVVKKKSDD